MRLNAYPFVLILIIIVVFGLASSAASMEVAYSMGPGGKIPIGQANITEYNGSDLVFFTVAHSESKSSATYENSRSIDSIKEEINRKVDQGNELVRNKGLDLVGNRSGPRRIDQICSIYEYMAGNWGYVDDWRGLEQFQYSNYTLRKGKEAGVSGKGDCDDFSILMASLIESIGGTSRIIFAYSLTGGHAYCEVYLGKAGDRNLERMLAWLRSQYRTENINTHIDLETGDVWLNMDWWKDTGKAEHPGGPFYQAEIHIPLYIQEGMPKTPLTAIENMPPIALFIYDPTQPEVDSPVSFSAIESRDPDGNVTNFEWDFGDGENARGALKSFCRHHYSTSGRFLVNLTVTDNEGDTGCKTIMVEVSEPLPEAVATYSPANPRVGDVITFDASQSKAGRGEITDYEWDFDDGYSGKRASIAHPFWKSGTYDVRLIVTNDKGIKGTSSIKVFIDEKVNASEWVDNGDALYGQGKYEEAIQAYDEAIKLDPNNEIACIWKGSALYELGKYDEAIVAYDRAISINSTFSWPWINKGNALQAQGSYDEAIRAFDEAIKLDPNDANARFNKGNAFQAQGKYDEAIAAYDRAISIDSTFSSPWNNKGRVLYGQGKYEEAIQAYDEAINLNPNLALAWNNKGLALKALGRTSEAEYAFAKARDLGYTG